MELTDGSPDVVDQVADDVLAVLNHISSDSLKLAKCWVERAHNGLSDALSGSDTIFDDVDDLLGLVVDGGNEFGLESSFSATSKKQIRLQVFRGIEQQIFGWIDMNC